MAHYVRGPAATPRAHAAGPCQCCRRSLEHVPRLLRGVEGAHGALDESPRRKRREDLLESLVGLGTRGIEEAKRGAELHPSTAVTSPSGTRGRTGPPWSPRPPRRRPA